MGPGGRGAGPGDGLGEQAEAWLQRVGLGERGGPWRQWAAAPWLVAVEVQESPPGPGGGAAG